MDSYRTLSSIILLGYLVVGGGGLTVAAADSVSGTKRQTVEGQVMRLDAESVEILLPQTAISSVAFDFQNPSETSDILTLRGGQLVLKGKIVEVTAKALLVRFPKESLNQIVVVSILSRPLQWRHRQSKPPRNLLRPAPESRLHQ